MSRSLRAKFSNTALFIAITIAGALLAAVLISQRANVLAESDVLARLAEKPEISAWASQPAEARRLSAAELEGLRNSQPVIYEGVPPDSWRVVYGSQSNGLFVIYDANKDAVLKTFQLASMRIG